MLLTLTRSRPPVLTGSARVWLAAALLFSVAAAIGFYHVPIASAAFYEYVGHALVQGKSLYRDVWDNKLPSIYYLNALWQLAFGSNYALHWLAELIVLLATVALFAAFAERERLRFWAPATFAFAVILSLPPQRHFNYTEPYALFAIMAALVAAQRRAPIASGVLLSVAATFWLPTVFQTIAIVVHCRVGAARVRFVGSFLASAAVFTLLFFSSFGTAAIVSGFREIYGWQSVYWNRSFPATEALKAWNTLDTTGLLVPFVVMLGLVRRPSTERERFALVWLGIALAGTAISLNLNQHEFLPAVAPLVFAMAVYAEGWHASRIRKIALGVLAVALVLHAPKMLAAMRDGIAGEMNDARDSVAVGRFLDAALPKHSRIMVYGYASGIYLSAQRDAAGRFPNHPDSAAASSPREDASQRQYLAGVHRADAVVAGRNAVFFPGLDTAVRADFTPPCSIDGTGFRIYLRRTLTTAAFCSHASSCRRHVSRLVPARLLRQRQSQSARSVLFRGDGNREATVVRKKPVTAPPTWWDDRGSNPDAVSGSRF